MWTNVRKYILRVRRFLHRIDWLSDFLYRVPLGFSDTLTRQASVTAGAEQRWRVQSGGISPGAGVARYRANSQGTTRLCPNLLPDTFTLNFYYIYFTVYIYAIPRYQS